MWFSKLFSDFSAWVAHATGKPVTFILCVGVVVVWALFGFSDTWQLLINTGTTIVTFLMVFLIQNTQNRDGAAIQAKLDELIRASAAQNAYIGIEHLSEEELDSLRARCEERARDVRLSDAADAAEESANAKAAAAARAAIES